MSVKDILQGFRNQGYASSKSSDNRILELTPEEMKVIPTSNQEMCLSVYGVLSDRGFQVSRVEPEDTDTSSSDPEGPPNRAMPSQS